MIFFSGSRLAQASDYRAAYVGTSLGTFLETQPNRSFRKPVYAIDTAYFVGEQLTVALSWEFELGGSSHIGLAAGSQYYLLLDRSLIPYVSAKFLYQLNREKDLGWRFNFGGEWNLVRWSKIDNLRLYFETGVSQIFRDPQPNLLQFEILRVGLSWNF